MAKPVWQTASGNLGTKSEGIYFSTQLVATDADGDTVNYTVISGSLPAGVFLGTTGNPAPVSNNEIGKILGNIKEGSLSPEPSLTFEVGEQVKVCEGPFASFSGLVEEVDEDKLKLKVSVSIFGRPTPIELEYNQVEKS